MVIYGGYGGQAGARIFSQEMYMLKIETLTWEKVTSEGAPSARGDHTSTVVDGKLLMIFGGRNHLQYYNSVHM